MKCIVTASEAGALENEGIGWLNALNELAETRIEVFRYQGEPLTKQEYDALSDADKKSCVIEGVIKGLVTSEGQTVTFAIPREIYQDTRWWFKEPDNPDWMTGMHDYTIEDFQENWIPPYGE